jgi:hypothetical protein
MRALEEWQAQPAGQVLPCRDGLRWPAPPPAAS